MTKYIHKDFENSARSAKWYWHTKNIEEIKVVKFWLGATNFHEALEEARDAVAMQGVAEMKIWGDDEIGNIWLQIFMMVDLCVLFLFNIMDRIFDGFTNLNNSTPLLNICTNSAAQ